MKRLFRFFSIWNLVTFELFRKLYVVDAACTVYKESFDSTLFVPDRVFWRSNAKEIILPTLSGQMGVLKDHIPLLTGLDTGVMKVRSESDSRWIFMAVMGGFALVNNNKVTILVNEAELGSDIDFEQAEQNFLEAKSSLDNLLLSDGKDKLEALLRFKKSKARFL